MEVVLKFSSREHLSYSLRSVYLVLYIWHYEYIVWYKINSNLNAWCFNSCDLKTVSMKYLWQYIKLFLLLYITHTWLCMEIYQIWCYYSLSDEDRDNADSLVIKPPQAVIQTSHRDKRTHKRSVKDRYKEGSRKDKKHIFRYCYLFKLVTYFRWMKSTYL